MLLLSALPTRPVMIGGDERQKKWIGEAWRSGAMKGAFCLTEPNHGSDAANLETRAVRDGDDYILNGEKMYISGGTVADYLIGVRAHGRHARCEGDLRVHRRRASRRGSASTGPDRQDGRARRADGATSFSRTCACRARTCSAASRGAASTTRC